MPSASGQTWVNVEEAAEILGFSTGRVRQLIAPKRRGGPRIASRMFGHIRRMRKVDVENYRPLTGPRGGRPVGYRPPVQPDAAVPREPRQRVQASPRGSPMVPFTPPKAKSRTTRPKRVPAG